MKEGNESKAMMANDVKHIREDKVDGLDYCVVRTGSAGVHIGYIKERNGKEVTLINSRRLWKWRKAATLSQVAVEGCDSDNFSIVLPLIILTNAVEIIPCTEKAKLILEGIPEWKV